MLAIETTNLSRSFKGKPAVKNLTMRVPEGSIYGFIGQNGAGKSTTQKMICGLLHPDAGSISLYEKSSNAGEIRSKIGVIIESPALFPGATAYENMMMQALNLGMQNPDATIRELLKLVGLSDTGKKKAKIFSLGMKQRLAIGQTLLGDPKLLILDEPTNGLDPQGIIEMRNTLKQVNQERGITILISSHILGELSRIATHYGIIKNGEMIEEISQIALREKCKEYMTIRTGDAHKAHALLHAELSGEYAVEEAEGAVHIHHYQDGETVNRLLASSGIYASEIKQHKMDLEEYFLSAMEGRIYA